MEVMAPRVLTRRLLRPEDVRPRFEGFEVIGAFNPAAVLLQDLDDPDRVVGISPWPVMLAEHDFERSGFLTDVVFPCGLVRRGEQLDVY